MYILTNKYGDPFHPIYLVMADHFISDSGNTAYRNRNEFMTSKGAGIPNTFNTEGDAEDAKTRYIMKRPSVGWTLDRENIRVISVKDYLEDAAMNKLCGGKSYYQYADILSKKSHDVYTG